MPEVALATYTSRDQALQEFRARHADDQLTLQALDQLGENPLGASLAVKATDPSKYAAIVNYLSDDSKVPGSSSIIERVNYYQNKTVIDRLTQAIKTTHEAGIAIALLFAIASIIITFATVRLAIYSARDEIAVMRLVGASNWFIRGPFIVSGIIGGIVSGIITLILFWPATWYAGQKFSSYLGGVQSLRVLHQPFPAHLHRHRRRRGRARRLRLLRGGATLPERIGIWDARDINTSSSSAG